MPADKTAQVDGFIQALQYISTCIGRIDSSLSEEQRSHSDIERILHDLTSAVKANTKAVEHFSEEMCNRDILQHIDTQQSVATTTIRNILHKGAWVLTGAGLVISTIITMVELSGRSIHDIITFLMQ
jgi:uncharacterized membrane protein